jgi:hypothetical protein
MSCFAWGYIKYGTPDLGIIISSIIIFAWLVFLFFHFRIHTTLAWKFGFYSPCMPTIATICTSNGKSKVMPYNPMEDINGFYHRRSDVITHVSKELINVDILVPDLVYKDHMKDTIKINAQFRVAADDQSIIALSKYPSLSEYIMLNDNFEQKKAEIEHLLRIFFLKTTSKAIDRHAVTSIISEELVIPNMELDSVTIYHIV